MVSRIFLDANVLLDLLLKRKGFLMARQIMEKIIAGEVAGYVSPSIVHILAYWLKKAYGNHKARELVLVLLVNVKVIEIDHETTIHALHSKIDEIEDALQYYTALHHELDALITEDKLLRKASTSILPIYTPEQLLRILA